MADVKISGLPASTVPLAGTEVLPIVQGGATKQVSIANVTAGRSVAAISVITPTIQAEAGSAGGTIKNGSGVAQMQWGSGGASNLSLEVATNINPANAAVSIAPTGTGTVTINPATASNMNNVAIGGTTPLAGKFTALEATGVTTVQAGSVSAPAITTTGDTNTGIYFPAADTIAFTEGGVEAMRIFSSSGVSIGNTTDPGAKNLSVSGSLSLVVTGSATALATKATTVLTSAVEIAPLNGTWGHLAIVTGLDPLEGFFTDLVFSSITAGPTVLSSKTVSASPSARTYSMSGSSFLSLAMASGTYEVRCSVFYGLS
jgi:hypothetical protein